MKAISKLVLGLAFSVMASAALAIPVGSWDAYDAKKITSRFTEIPSLSRDAYDAKKSPGIWFKQNLGYNGKKYRMFKSGTMFNVDTTGAAYSRSRGDVNLDMVAVAEPSTVFLMGLGLMGVGLTRRLKKS